MVELTLAMYRRNYIEGLFLSSGVLRDPDYTMQLVTRVGRTLRTTHRFGGYIHLKAVAGASAELIAEAGQWCDRLSVNIELPSATDLAALAPEKQVPSIHGCTANAVKHFRFLPRGKKRLHQRPTADQVRACKPWLGAELELLGPRVVGSPASAAAWSRPTGPST